MIAFKMKVNGLFARLKKGDAGDIVRNNARGCLKQAVEEYVTGTQTPSLSKRMVPGAIMAYGFKRRSPEYVKQQIRDGGGERPYASPRKTNYARLALIISQPHRFSPQQLLKATEALARAYRTPMRRLVTRSGGYNIQVAGAARVLRIKLTLPGARILNRGGSRNEAYRNQLLDLSLGAGRDRAFIYARTHQLMQDNAYRFSNGPSGSVRGLRGLKRAMRRIA